MNTKDLVAKIRNIIADNTSLALTDVFSPDLPQEGTNICTINLLGGNPTNNLCGLQYIDETFRVLIRGTNNDTTTRAIADEIFNALHLKSNISYGTNNKIIQIFCTTTPIFVREDENQRILYNITFTVKGE